MALFVLLYRAIFEAKDLVPRQGNTLNSITSHAQISVLDPTHNTITAEVELSGKQMYF